MFIGVPEIKTDEYRVSLTPATVGAERRNRVGRDHGGAGAALPTRAPIAAGAGSSRMLISSARRLIVKVKAAGIERKRLRRGRSFPITHG
jgi:alanine dehydrogenase